MALLLQNVRLTLPLPYEELPLLFAPHGDPVSLCIYRYAVDLVLRYLEGVNGLECVKIVQTEHSIRLANYQDHFAGCPI